MQSAWLITGFRKLCFSYSSSQNEGGTAIHHSQGPASGLCCCAVPAGLRGIVRPRTTQSSRLVQPLAQESLKLYNLWNSIQFSDWNVWLKRLHIHCCNYGNVDVWTDNWQRGCSEPSIYRLKILLSQGRHMGHKGRRQKQKGGANLPQNEKTPKEAVIRAGTGLCKSGNTFKTEMRSDFIKAHWNKWWNNDLINLNTNILFCLQNEQPWHLLSLGLGEGAGDTVLLYSFTPSASSKILIFSLLLNYTGCQSTVGDILSGEIYTNTQSTLRRLSTISFTPSGM